MDQELTKFEQESTKPPIWLPIVGVILFFIMMTLAVTCTGSPPEIEEHERVNTEQQGASQ